MGADFVFKVYALGSGINFLVALSCNISFSIYLAIERTFSSVGVYNSN